MLELLFLISLTTHQIQGGTQKIRTIQPTVQIYQGNEGESNILVNYEASDTLQDALPGRLLQ